MNKLYYGDNLEVMRKYIPNESVDLCYIDPPFNSNKNYNIIYDGSTAQATAFTDVWSKNPPAEEEEFIFNHIQEGKYGELFKVLQGLKILLEKNNPKMYSYLVNIGIRIVEIHRVLKSTGSFYLHCDPTASHYLKILLDGIFGEKNFRNEIVWSYKSGGVSKSRFAKKHDIILFYTKTEKYFFNVQKERTYKYNGIGKSSLQEYFKDEKGDEYCLVSQTDVFNDIGIISTHSKVERTGYPTQKPLALLERIIKASCPEGGTVLDAYAGCATTCVAAQKLNRNWIGIDITYLAIKVIKDRLLKEFYYDKNPKIMMEKFNKDVSIFGIPFDIEGARALAKETQGDKVRKEFEKWAVFSIGGVFNEKKGGDKGLDGFLYIRDYTEKMEMKKIALPISVKSNATVVPAYIRELRGTIEREKTPAGIFISLEEPSEGCKVEANQGQPYKNGWSKITYPQIIIITAQEIIDHSFITKLPIRDEIIPKEQEKPVITKPLI